MRLKQSLESRNRVQRILALADAAAPDPPCPAYVFADLPLPSAPSLAVGDAIRLADSVRIFEQYARILTRGWREPDSPIGQFLSHGLVPLAWFDRLDREEIPGPAIVATFHRQLSLYAPEPALPEQQQYYALLRDLPHPPLHLARLITSLAIPGAKQYHAHIARLLAADRLPWDRYIARVEGWREQGLLYPLCLAAHHMPTLNDWLPVELHEEAGAWADILTRVQGAKTSGDLDSALGQVSTRVDWSGRAGLAIAATLDALAIRMRLLSHRNADLDASVNAFPDLDTRTPPQIWKQLVHVLERHVPPSALCPRMTGFKQATWGYECLTPFWDGHSLRFAERTLQWVEPRPFSPRPAAPQRLPEVLARVGVVALSREFGYLMNLAIDGCDYLAEGKTTITENERRTCETPDLLLHFMRKPELLSDDRDVEDMILSLFSSLPGVAVDERPVTLSAWRLSPPPRIVLDARTILDDRSAAGPVSRIVASQDIFQSMRAELRIHMRDPVVEFPRSIPRGVHTAVLHETLWEMGQGPPLLHTRIPLHGENPWTNDHEDRRYAETQAAANGHRYRDWIAVHQEAKCRLDSHTVRAKRVFHTFFPLQTPDGCQWVRVAASLRPDLRVLHCRTPAKTRLDQLATGVKARFLQDLKLLPTSASGHRVERNNTAVYVDRASRQVMLVYAPTGDNQLQFMLFQMAA